jgi:hypothetical protein
MLISATGTRRRLTFTRGDDGGGAYSPDGRFVVFNTARWNRLDHYDLAILRLGTDSVFPLTQSDASDGLPFWSPDGERIAFSRRYFNGQPSQVCWSTPDRHHTGCFVPPGLTGEYGVAGWLSPDRIVVLGNGITSPLIIAVDLLGFRSQVLQSGTFASISPDGRYVTCLCRLPGRNRPTWAVFPGDHPEDLKEAQLPDSDAGSWTLNWAPGGRAPRYIDRVSIVSPRRVPVGVPERLRVDGHASDGGEVGVPLVEWATSDSSVATIDSTGLLTPKSLGQVVVHASAGGWRRDSITLIVRQLDAVTRLSENWSGGVRLNFEDYGVPRPRIIDDPNDQPAFLNNGDGSYESGAYSTLEFRATEGLGVEARVATPVNRTQWQNMNVELNAGIELAASSGWDRNTGYLPAHGRLTMPLCRFTYPKGEGVGSSDSIALVGGNGSESGRASSLAKSGRWYSVRVQIFPDGRCGMAIDGKPVLMAEIQLPLDQPYRLDLEGNSVGTKMLVGPLDVWEGVKGGVDWSALSVPSH